MVYLLPHVKVGIVWENVCYRVQDKLDDVFRQGSDSDRGAEQWSNTITTLPEHIVKFALNSITNTPTECQPSHVEEDIPLQCANFVQEGRL